MGGGLGEGLGPMDVAIEANLKFGDDQTERAGVAPPMQTNMRLSKLHFVCEHQTR